MTRIDWRTLALHAAINLALVGLSLDLFSPERGRYVAPVPVLACRLSPAERKA